MFMATLILLAIGLSTRYAQHQHDAIRDDVLTLATTVDDMATLVVPMARGIQRLDSLQTITVRKAVALEPVARANSRRVARLEHQVAGAVHVYGPGPVR